MASFLNNIQLIFDRVKNYIIDPQNWTVVLIGTAVLALIVLRIIYNIFMKLKWRKDIRAGHSRLAKYEIYNNDPAIAEIFQRANETAHKTLIPCPACGHNISATAMVCPQCGYNFMHSNYTEVYRRILAPQGIIVFDPERIYEGSDYSAFCIREQISDKKWLVTNFQPTGDHSMFCALKKEINGSIFYNHCELYCGQLRPGRSFRLVKDPKRGMTLE